MGDNETPLQLCQKVFVFRLCLVSPSAQIDEKKSESVQSPVNQNTYFFLPIVFNVGEFEEFLCFYHMLGLKNKNRG